MASRKKGKKPKLQTIALTDFLANNGGAPPIPLKTTSWADDVEDEHEGAYMSRSSKEPIVLPTAPRAARGPGGDYENIPTSPPFVAFVSNLPYDVVEDDLADFFAEMQVSNVRLPKDSTKLRGYGYVEFDDRASLIEALNMSNTLIKTRRVRIEVSNSSNDERRGGKMGMGRDNRRDGYDDPERTSGDWRSRPREEPSGERDDRFRSRGGFDNRDRRDDREGSETDNKPGGWREGERNTSSFGERRTFRDDNRRGGGGGFRDDDRRGGGGGFRDDDRRGFRDDDRRGGGGGFRDDDRRGFRDDDRREEKERDWSRETNTGGLPPPRRNDRERDDAPSGEPRTRPALNLLPRTKPIEAAAVKEEIKGEPKEDEAEETKAIKETKEPKANIFGAAKPVDTAAKEREIEERLAKTQAEKAKSEDGKSEGTWLKRNGEGRSDREKEKPRAPAWRSDEDRDRGDSRGDSRGPPPSRPAVGSSRSGKYEARGPPEKERREKEKERERDVKDDPPMPKATDEQAPNFVASNKYSMLNEDADTDTNDD